MFDHEKFDFSYTQIDQIESVEEMENFVSKINKMKGFKARVIKKPELSIEIKYNNKPLKIADGYFVLIPKAIAYSMPITELKDFPFLVGYMDEYSYDDEFGEKQIVEVMPVISTYFVIKDKNLENKEGIPVFIEYYEPLAEIEGKNEAIKFMLIMRSVVQNNPQSMISNEPNDVELYETPLDTYLMNIKNFEIEENINQADRSLGEIPINITPDMGFGFVLLIKDKVETLADLHQVCVEEVHKLEKTGLEILKQIK